MRYGYLTWKILWRLLEVWKQSVNGRGYLFFMVILLWPRKSTHGLRVPSFSATKKKPAGRGSNYPSSEWVSNEFHCFKLEFRQIVKSTGGKSSTRKEIYRTIIGSVWRQRESLWLTKDLLQVMVPSSTLEKSGGSGTWLGSVVWRLAGGRADWRHEAWQKLFNEPRLCLGCVSLGYPRINGVQELVRMWNWMISLWLPDRTIERGSVWDRKSVV